MMLITESRIHWFEVGVFFSLDSNQHLMVYYYRCKVLNGEFDAKSIEISGVDCDYEKENITCLFRVWITKLFHWCRRHSANRTVRSEEILQTL